MTLSSGHEIPMLAGKNVHISRTVETHTSSISQLYHQTGTYSANPLNRYYNWSHITTIKKSLTESVAQGNYASAALCENMTGTSLGMASVNRIDLGKFYFDT